MSKYATICRNMSKCSNTSSDVRNHSDFSIFYVCSVRSSICGCNPRRPYICLAGLIGMRDCPYGICCPWVVGGLGLDALGKFFRRRRRRSPLQIIICVFLCFCFSIMPGPKVSFFGKRWPARGKYQGGTIYKKLDTTSEPPPQFPKQDSKPGF